MGKFTFEKKKLIGIEKKRNNIIGLNLFHMPFMHMKFECNISRILQCKLRYYLNEL